MKVCRVAALGLVGLLASSAMAHAQESDQERLKRLEEQVQALLKEQQKLKEEQTANEKRIQDLLQELKNKPASAPAQPVVRPDTQTAPPPAQRLPFTLSGDITFRFDDTSNKSLETGLVPVGDQGSFRQRVRLNFGAPLSDRSDAGLQITTGENTNPTSPFVTLGDGFRSKNFSLGRAFLNFYFGAKGKPGTPVLTVGKMDNPLWRGEIGNWDDEIAYDHDVAPEGIALKLPLTRKSRVGLSDTAAFYSINIPNKQRFIGLTTEIYSVVNQLKLDSPYFRGALNYMYYNNLNSGLLIPTFIPGFGIDPSTPRTAFLLRDGSGFQTTNNHYSYGTAFGFGSNDFNIIHLAGQVLPPKFKYGLQPFINGDYLHNFSVRTANDGYGITLGLTKGGTAKGAYTTWFTWREVDADATLGTFADSDLGAGTDYRGYQTGFAYRFLSNTLFRIAYQDFDGYPHKTQGTSRLFVDVSRSF